MILSAGFESFSVQGYLGGVHSKGSSLLGRTALEVAGEDGASFDKLESR